MIWTLYVLVFVCFNHKCVQPIKTVISCLILYYFGLVTCGSSHEDKTVLRSKSQFELVVYVCASLEPPRVFNARIHKHIDVDEYSGQKDFHRQGGLFPE